jgi:hypothetical protein
MTYAVTRQQLETYKVGPCMISLDADQGFVSVTCSEYDELNGSHYWRARGSDSLKRFLIGLNCDYATGKLFGNRRLMEWDEDQTKTDIKRYIIECRRDGSLDRSQARDLWDDVESAESEESIADLPTVNGECWYEWIQHREKPCVDWFWSKVWSPFVQTLRQELASCPPSVQCAS